MIRITAGHFFSIIFYSTICEVRKLWATLLYMLRGANLWSVVMKRKGRPPRLPEERDRFRKESLARARATRKLIEKERIETGLCKVCGHKLAPTSKVFCLHHLELHRNYCKSRKRSRFSTLKMNSRRRGIDFAFMESTFKKWIDSQPQECCYCGVTSKQLGVGKNVGLTIDRKDNNAGYTPENACLACFRCNNMKSDFFTHEAWKKIANEFIRPRLAEFHRSMQRARKTRTT